MTIHRRLRIAAVAIVGALLTAGSLSACGEPDPDVSVTGVEFVSSNGIHFPSARRGASFVLPAGLPGEVQVRFSSGVAYPRCTLDFDGQAQLGVSNFGTVEDSQKPQMVSKRTGALRVSAKVPGTLTCNRDKAGSVPKSSSFVATIVLSPMVTATPKALTFARVPVGGTSPALKVTVNSTGTAPAQITSIVYPRQEFVLDTDGCSGKTLKVGTWCSFRLVFAPKDRNARTSGVATITLGGDALIAPDPIPLTAAIDFGEGLFSPSSDPLEFGFVSVGSSAERTLTVTNSGTGYFYVKYVTLAREGEVFTTRPGAEWVWPITTQLYEYSIAQDGCSGVSLAGGATCQVRLTFSPTDAPGFDIERYLVFLADSTVQTDLLSILIPITDLSLYHVKLTGRGEAVPDSQPTSDPQPQPHG